MTKNTLKRAIATMPARSAWSKGVKLYAIDLIDSLDGFSDWQSPKLVAKALLDGADDWRQYSEGGCARVYDSDIAERLCSPSELKKTRNGARNPNSRENWIDCQARALGQAARLVRKAIKVQS